MALIDLNNDKPSLPSSVNEEEFIMIPDKNEIVSEMYTSSASSSHIAEPNLQGYIFLKRAAAKDKKPNSFAKKWTIYANGLLKFYNSETDRSNRPIFYIDMDDAVFTINELDDESQTVLTVNVPSYTTHEVSQHFLKFETQSQLLNWLTNLQNVSTNRAKHKINVFRSSLGLPYYDTNVAEYLKDDRVPMSTPTRKSSILAEPAQRIFSKAKQYGNAIFSNLESIEKKGYSAKNLTTNLLYHNVDSDGNVIVSYDTCSNCQKLSAEVNSLKMELSNSKQQLDCSNDELMFLNKQLEAQRKQSNLSNTNLDEAQSQLSTQINQISQLECFMAITEKEKEKLVKENEQLKKELGNTQLELETYREAVATKDQMLLNLANEEQRSSRNSELSSLNSATKFYASCDALSEQITRYRTYSEKLVKSTSQLNVEILRLAELCHMWDVACRLLEQRVEDKVCQISSLEQTIANLKASSMQSPRSMLTESNTMSPIDEPISYPASPIPSIQVQKETESVPQTPDKLMASLDLGDSRLRSNSIMYDRFGFQINASMMLGDGPEMASLAQQKPEISNLMITKWEKILQEQRDVFANSKKHEEVKNMIRYGIPDLYRGKIWKMCVDLQAQDVRRAKPSLTKESKTFNPVYKEIELDLLRTLPENIHYESQTADGIPKLRRVLRAYSHHNPAIGYCQGFNRIVAIALLFLSEEDAFWCLLAIVEKILPQGYFNNYLIAAHADQRVFRDLLQEKVPQVGAHFGKLDLDVSLFTFPWFVTVFVESFPTDMMLSIWDAFLFEGSKVLFRWALAIFKLREEDILKYKDHITLNEYMRLVGSKIQIPEIAKLREIAYEQMNPLSLKTIKNKRDFHLRQAKEEMKDFMIARNDWAPHPSEESRVSFIDNPETNSQKAIKFINKKD